MICFIIKTQLGLFMLFNQQSLKKKNIKQNEN